MTTSSLNQVLQGHFAVDGYILIPGLIPRATVDAAVDALWASMRLSPDAPEAWPGTITAHPADDPAILACYTPELLAVAAGLTGADPGEIAAPASVSAVNSYPLKMKGRWKWPKPHIDAGSKASGHPIEPPTHQLLTLIYLSDVASHGGGTVVWPGSHQLIQRLAADHTYMWQLNEQLGQLDLGAPVEMTPRRGDVLCAHRLLVHAGSANTTAQPRLALRHKWGWAAQ